MKAVKDLVASDFPGVNPQKFEEWKQASIKANKNTAIFLIITILVVAGILLATGGILVGLIPMAVFLAINAAIWSEARRLEKELGINRAAVDRARTEEPQSSAPPPSPVSTKIKMKRLIFIVVGIIVLFVLALLLKK